MANQRIDQLNAETTPAAADLLPIYSVAGADTKKITVKNLVQVGATLIDDASIPGSKVNVTGLLTGAIVNADINANAEIAVSKLVDGTARQLLQTDAAGTGVEWASNIDIPGTLDVTNAATFDSTVAVTGALTKSGSNVVTVGDTGTVTSTMILDGTIVNADINASAGIVDTKLATIATAGKVSNSSTTATDANTASAIVARNASGDFTAGTITATLTGTASTVITNANLTGDIISTGNATSIATGVIVNADINAAAGIVDTKLATIVTAGKVSNSATTAASANTASAIVARDASGNFTAGTITAALTGTASGNMVSGGALGTPSSGTLTSCTGLPISTGVSGLGSGAATFLATPSSANLAALLTDETGTGANVFATSPTLVSPALGTPSSGVLTNCTGLPIATVSVAGAMLPGTGLSVTGGGVVNHTNSVTAGTTSGVTFDAQGHITATTALVGGDLPVATSGVKGAVRPGTGLTVDGSGILDISAATNIALGGVIAGSDFGISTGTISLATQGGLTAGTYTKATFNSKGIATGGTALVAGDIPNLAASQITSGSLDIARIATNTVTSAKLANYAVTKIGDTQPTADHIGEFFFNPLSRDLFLWDGNVYQPIGISVGEIVFAGTFDASLGSGTGLISSVTPEGTAIGLAIGQTLPAPAAGNSRYYFVVAEGGTITTGNAPHVVLAPPDILLSNGITWTEVDISQTITAQTANNISFTPAGSIVSVNVQTAIQELDGDKLPIAGGTITGNLEIGAAGSLSFEGSTTNDFETTLAVVDPTADRTITLPNITGTVVTTGDTGTVTSTMLLDGTILNADVNASAGIVDTKLATIATAGKVSNSATTATDSNTANAIVARNASGNFSAGTITAAVTGAASSNVLKAGDTMTGVLAVTAGTAALPAITPSGDANTGIFSPGADQLAVATNGVARLTTSTTAISSALPIDVPLGAVGAPSFTFTGDLNTGFYSPAADTLAAVTAGSNRLHITSGGLVGIGSSAPSFLVDCIASSLPTLRIYDNLGSGTRVSGRLLLGASTTRGVSIANSTDTYDDTNSMVFSTTDSGGVLTERVRISPEGRLGIGSSAPSFLVDCIASSLPTLRIYDNLGSGTRVSGRLLLGASTTRGVSIANSTDTYDDTNSMVFSTTDSGGVLTERVRINSSGRLLVGIIASPAHQLQVSTDSAGKPSTNTWTIVSDERIKEDIELADLDLCYEAVKTIPLKRFKWKDEVYTEEQVKDRRKLGWIAQDVEAVFPKAVGTYEFKYNQVFEETIIPAVEEVLDDEGNVTTPAQPERIEKGELISEDVIEDCRDLNSDQLYAAMYGAIQKLMVKVETLETEVALLKTL